jgi:hypothetical protein
LEVGPDRSHAREESAQVILRLTPSLDRDTPDEAKAPLALLAKTLHFAGGREHAGKVNHDCRPR